MCRSRDKEVVVIEPLVNEEELEKIPLGKIVAVDVKTGHVIAYVDTVYELTRIMMEKVYRIDDYIMIKIPNMNLSLSNYLVSKLYYAV